MQTRSVGFGGVAEEEKSEQMCSQSSHVDEWWPCIRSGVYEGLGSRYDMEDTHIVLDNAEGLPAPSASFYAVFDGHAGDAAAVFARDHLFENFLKQDMATEESMDCGKLHAKVESALVEAFVATDVQFKDTGKKSGTTAIAAVVIGRELFVANAGDCRAVVCRKGRALAMSEDHDPRRSAAEYLRICAAGGHLDDGYLNGYINMSRAIGDWDMEGLKKGASGMGGPLISVPEVRHERLTDEDEFMIVASDGLFKKCSSQSAVDFVRCRLREHDDLHECARELVHRTWSHERNINILPDNSTAVIVSFQKRITVSPVPSSAT